MRKIRGWPEAHGQIIDPYVLIFHGIPEPGMSKAT